MRATRLLPLVLLLAGAIAASTPSSRASTVSAFPWKPGYYRGLMIASAQHTFDERTPGTQRNYFSLNMLNTSAELDIEVFPRAGNGAVHLSGEYRFYVIGVVRFEGDNPCRGYSVMGSGYGNASGSEPHTLDPLGDLFSLGGMESSLGPMSAQFTPDGECGPGPGPALRTSVDTDFQQLYQPGWQFQVGLRSGSVSGSCSFPTWDSTAGHSLDCVWRAFRMPR